jgi:cell division protein FtsA
VAQLNGLIELIAEEMDLPVRIGCPDRINGVSDATKSPAYATAVGLVLYGVNNLSYLQAAPAENIFWWNHK